MKIRHVIQTDNNLDYLVQFASPFSLHTSTYWEEQKPTTAQQLSVRLPSGEVVVAEVVASTEEGMMLEVGAPAFSTIPGEFAKWVGGWVERSPDVKVAVSFEEEERSR